MRNATHLFLHLSMYKFNIFYYMSNALLLMLIILSVRSLLCFFILPFLCLHNLFYLKDLEFKYLRNTLKHVTYVTFYKGIMQNISLNKYIETQRKQEIFR